MTESAMPDAAATRARATVACVTDPAEYTGREAGSRLRISGIEEDSIVDGPGLRLVVFTQGCPHHCKGCHNPETHSSSGGHWCAVADIVARYRQNPLLDGITLSGGEPFCQAGVLCGLAEEVRALGGDVVTYTGYTFEALLDKAVHDADIGRLLSLTDILVDGPYVEALRDMDLPYWGSSNQRPLNREQRAELAARHGSHC